MKILKRKLTSQTGATITWALLIFLVCAAVGSIVLVAGTAAAGRLSKLAEYDQKYYAVNSAAQFLKEVLEDEDNAATVERKKVAKETKQDYKIVSGKEEKDGDEIPDSNKITYSWTLVEDGNTPNPAVTDASTIQEQVALALLGLNDTSIDSAQWDKTDFDVISSNTIQYQIQPTLDSDTTLAEKLYADVDITADKEGTLTVSVEKDGYAVKMTFKLDHSKLTQTASRKEENRSREFTAADTFTETYDLILTKTDIFTWKMSSIQ